MPARLGWRDEEAHDGRIAWLFLRLLGVVYLAAFWSLGTQIVGLIEVVSVGSGASTPLSAVLSLSKDGFSRTFSESTAQVLCYGGAALSLALIAGLAPAVVLVLLWLDYYALTVACAPFLPYQWDTLLLETGFLAVFLAPWVWRERRERLEDPPRLAVWMFRWLLFRLMVASGAAKLTSGDPTWRDLTALAFHFETQPLPTPIAWYLHQLPGPVLKTMTGLSLAIELAAPFLILGGRRLRLTGFALLAGLQAVIALTGNYTFFNLLSAALCLFMLDDRLLARSGGRVADRTTALPWRKTALIVVAFATLPVSLFMFAGSLRVRLPGAVFVEPIAEIVLPLRLVNRYGLFAVMTTTRPEIVIEGTEDGATWREYEFKYKPGDVKRRPSWVAPHQPRLDWQMWFAALGEWNTEPWLHDFCYQLLDANPKILALLARDPFDGRKPRAIRAVLYQYRFSGWTAGRRDGTWWLRERFADYSPVISAP